jgi:hypothetical protein
MPDASYFRDQVERCRRLAGLVTTADVVESLLQMAEDYERKAVELESRPGGKDASPG